MEKERNWLAEIAIMLFSLALRAELAAAQSRRERWRVLEFIREAQAAGFRCAAREGMIQPHLLDGDYPAASAEGYSRADALRLSVGLKMLALALHFQARLYDPQPEKHPLPSSNSRRVAARRPGRGRYCARSFFAFSARDPPLSLLPLWGEERFAQQTESPGMGFSSERTPGAIAKGRVGCRPECEA